MPGAARRPHPVPPAAPCAGHRASAPAGSRPVQRAADQPGRESSHSRRYCRAEYRHGASGRTRFRAGTR